MVAVGCAICLAIGWYWPIVPNQDRSQPAEIATAQLGTEVLAVSSLPVATGRNAMKSDSITTPTDRDVSSGSLANASVAARIATERIPIDLSNPSHTGALLLCGGGKLPDEIYDRFFQLGGGDQGTLVVIPTASPRSDMVELTEYLRSWTRFAWKQVCVLHADSRDQAQQDEFAAALNSATAVWISGGDQNRLTSRYRGTPVESKLAEVIRRGGVLGGTSAGTAVTSPVMIAGGYRFPIISEGFNLLPGVIVDQHFSQRRRYQRLQSALQRYPQCVGYGIDEGTGLLIGRQRAEVIGRGQVFVYNAPKLPTGEVVTASLESQPAQVFPAGTVIPVDLAAPQGGFFATYMTTE
jgi:cyanophycinase